MKYNTLIVAMASLLLASCAAHYVATDSVGRNLDGSRQVLAVTNNIEFKGWRLDSLAEPQIFDFRNEKDTMRFAYTIDLARGGWTLRQDSLSFCLQPEVGVNKHFRWFTTRYTYTARFPQLDSLPVPIGDYLTPDEQRLLLTPNELPDDWTGTDLYGLLDKLNTKYVRWWDHCLFEKEMEAYAAHCDSAQRALLYSYHDTLLAIILEDLPDNRKSLENVSHQFPELSFIGDIAAANFGISYAVFGWAYERWDLNTRVLWQVELPGGRTTEYMVSADRMILGDYTINLSSSVPNWWAIVLTLLVASIPLVLVFRPRNRMR